MDNWGIAVILLLQLNISLYSIKCKPKMQSLMSNFTSALNLNIRFNIRVANQIII